MDSVLWLRVGSGLMFLAVAMGAFGAHALKDSLSEEMRTIFETAVRYQVYHALAILAAVWIRHQFNAKYAATAAICFAVGILLFSGSLYALTLSGIRKFGMITPIGGLFFLAGWALLVFSPYKS